MAAKYQLMTELYRRTGIAVAKNPQAWQSFLAAACRNYKCRFDEQLLIYGHYRPYHKSGTHKSKNTYAHLN